MPQQPDPSTSACATGAATSDPFANAVVVTWYTSGSYTCTGPTIFRGKSAGLGGTIKAEGYSVWIDNCYISGSIKGARLVRMTGSDAGVGGNITTETIDQQAGYVSGNVKANNIISIAGVGGNVGPIE